MSFYAFLKLNPNPSKHDIEESFDGNLCRCTGYRPILEVAKSFAHSENQKCSSESCQSSSCETTANKLNEYKEYDPNLEIPFPSEFINDTDNLSKKPVVLKFENSIWLEPSNLAELLKVKNSFPNAKIVGGNTEIGVEMNIRSIDYRTFINISNVKEIKHVSIVKGEDNKNYLELGANITLSCLIDELKSLKSNLSFEKHYKTLLDALLSNLRWFASRQIRNFATLAGNIVTGSPISDLNPILVANNAILTVLSETDGKRDILIRNFYKGYRLNDLKSNEILLKVSIPLPSSPYEYIRAYKQSKRKDDDIAIANACFKVKFDRIDENIYLIQDLEIAYGGLGPTTIYLSKLNKIAKGFHWNEVKNLEFLQQEILNEINFSYSVPGGMPSYRRCLAVSFFTRFWYQAIKDLQIKIADLDLNLLSNLEDIERNISSGLQDYGQLNNSDFSIGTTNPHVSALKQTTGVAQYLDDIPKQNGELYAGIVMSAKAHALIKSIDPSEALSLQGVYGFFDHKHIHHNMFGPIRKDEEFFASKEVFFAGQTIGIIFFKKF